ncbi:hypothetical protein K1719_006201 [Acacia pycnantha]|nr:hypothetical protein K1719_006201 [Acacia pycnantha]
MDALNTVKVKTAAPPLLVDSLRSTKKVRIRPDGVEDSKEDGCGGRDEVDVNMTEVDHTGVGSYRSKLLNIDSANKGGRPRDEVVVSENDYLIGRDGEVLSIDFSKEVREVLAQGMERTLIIKLLGRSVTYVDLMYRTQAIWKPKGSYQLVDMEGNFYFAMFDLEEDYTKVLTGGPWTIFGAYLTVQPWTIDFDPATTSISSVVAWVRVPGLAFRYYHKGTLRAIGKLLGEVVKIDYRTESRGRGKYARIAVVIDLQQPLIPWIKIDGKTYGVEYEGLPLICFSCGKYGHAKDKCKGASHTNNVVPSREHDTMVRTSSKTLTDKSFGGTAAGPFLKPGSTQYGSWMQADPVLANGVISGSTKGSGPEGNKGSNDNVKNREGEIKGNIGASGSARVGATRNKHGASKPAQVYRKKVSAEDSVAKAPEQAHKALNDQPYNSEGALNQGKGDVAEVRPLTSEPAREQSGMVTSPSPGFQAVEAVSTLNRNNHTVIELQRQKQVLGEVTPAVLNIMEPGINEQSGLPGLSQGQENEVMWPSGKQLPRGGIRLQSTSTRNLKVRKKKSGVHISKDALGVIQEEWASPVKLNTVMSCSLEHPTGTGEGDDDATGFGMTI